MEMATPDLPQEILMGIFSRLSAKSVGKCRCLAKPWRTLLSTPEFLKSHFTRKPHHENLILVTPSRSIHSIPTTNAAAAAVSRNLDLLTNSSEVASSCDGLVLLVNEEQDKFLVNPITLEQVKIPDSPLALPKDGCFILYGFGYDSSCNDYKIVTLSYYSPNYGGADLDLDDDVRTDVYSVKTGIWKRVDSCPYYDHIAFKVSAGAFVNGAIHWLAITLGYPCAPVITAFNFVDEVFDKIPLPSDLDVRRFVCNGLVVLGGCLGMFDITGWDIWIMKEYGVGDSWTKLSIDADCDWEIVKPLCFIGYDEIVFLTEEEETLVVYNLKERMFRDMVVDGAPAKYTDGVTFVESLVSPAGRI